MKKNKLFKETAALIIAGTIGIYQINAQTHGAGAINSNLSVGTQGTNHCFIGGGAGQNNGVGGNYNSFFGENSGNSNTTGDNNTFTGFEAGKTSTVGYNNTFNGYQAGYSNGSSYTTGGNNHTFIGYQAGYNTGTNDSEGISVKNTFVGSSSGFSNTTGANNVFTGNNAGYSNTTGYNNTISGSSALYTNTTGFANTANGYLALYSNTTGNYNTANGRQSMYSNTIGLNNAANGTNTLYSNINGDYNAANGVNALFYNTSGDNNSANGNQALYNNSSGNGNTASGYQALLTNTTGSYNTAIGYFANVSTNNLTNATAIGNTAVATLSNSVQLGNSTTTNGVFTSSGLYQTSDGRFKTGVQEAVKGLEFIKKLRPVTYQINTNMLDDLIIQNLSDSLKAIHKIGMDFAGSSAVTHSGFIAQEVALAAQQANFNSSIVHQPANSSDPYALSYQEIVVPLVKAVQELSKTIDSLQTAMNACCRSQAPRSMQQTSADDSQTATKKTDVELSNKNIIVLDQNVPNPFAEQTVINYFLPDNFTRAQIIFLEQSGKLIKAVDLTEKGKGTLNVFANDLTNGIYTYSLIVDGKTIETKRMVKTK